MCTIFGVLDYQGKLAPAQRLALFRALADAAQMRGTDASGVAYVHNGVIYNDEELRRSHRLPPTRVETDSYAAVQILERGGKLTMDSLRRMTEALQGTFTITVLDASNTMYFVKGNNPLTIRLYPQLGCYLYASTSEILNMALTALGLSRLAYTDVPISQGDIMAVDARGQRAVSRFDDTHIQPQFYDGWGWYGPVYGREPDGYLETVIEYGKRRGVSERELRLLVDAGYDALDLEEMIHDSRFRENCVREIMADFGVC